MRLIPYHSRVQPLPAPRVNFSAVYTTAATAALVVLVTLLLMGIFEMAERRAGL